MVASDVSPHAGGDAAALPPEGADSPLGAARRGEYVSPHAGGAAAALPAEGAARRGEHNKPLLQVSELNQFYGGSHILRDLSLQAWLGRVTVVLGRNGAGKTTLLKSLMGLVAIKSGSIEFNGKPIHQRTPYERARAGIGFVPQGREIFARLTVRENLAMGLATKPAGTPIPSELFELFPVLQQMLGRRGGDLSGGQQQQLAIARALAAKPQLLILDEPTEGIQPSIIKDIGRVIRMLADRGDMAIVLVEQYYDFARELADDYVVMERGSVLARGLGSAMEADAVRELVSI